MWDKALESAMSTGLFAVLFVVLLYWVLSTNNDREKRYITVIDTQAKGLQKIDSVEADVHDIKQDMKTLLFDKRGSSSD